MAAESKIEKYLTARVKSLKGVTRKLRFLDRRGAPDRLVWLPGWEWPKLVELKAPGKDLEPHQKREHKRLKHTGIKCVKLDSFGDVDRFLRTR